MSKLHQEDGLPCDGQKVCLATTVYDRPDDSYTFSIASSREALHQAGIGTAYYLLQGNCHVDDARNRIVQEFLLSDCTDLVFLDADVSWKPQDLVRLCQYDEDVIGAVYPYKREDKADEMPVRLLRVMQREDGLIEAEGLPTGFLRIRRGVIEAMTEDAESFDGNNGHESLTPLLFQRTLINGTRWGGDLDFCNRWRARGGRVMCDPEITLGHSAKVTFTDSLGAFNRRQQGRTLAHVVGKIREGTWTVEDLQEARRYDDNPFGANDALLAIAIGFAKQATGPIIESGSGLSTILMAAATEHTVYCLEHSENYAHRLRYMSAISGVGNIGLCVCPIRGRWYDTDGKTLPDHFAVGLNDGPPRLVGDRMEFMARYGDKVDVMICDDADERQYRDKLTQWADEHQRESTYIKPRTLVIR